MSERARLQLESNGASERSWACMDILLAKVADLTDIANRIEYAVETSQSTGSSSSDEENADIGDDFISPDASLNAPDTRWKLTALLAGNDVVWRIKPQYSSSSMSYSTYHV